MPDRSASFRSDEHLATILDEPDDWTVNGPRGVILGTAHGLRIAIEMAGAFHRWGGRVVYVARKPSSDIIVFIAQLQKLMQRLAA
jgi:hypothetical protein